MDNLSQLDWILTHLRKYRVVRSAPDTWNEREFPADKPTIISESQAQWLLKRDYIRYAGLDSQGFAVWYPGKRLK